MVGRSLQYGAVDGRGVTLVVNVRPSPAQSCADLMNGGVHLYSQTLASMVAFVCVVDLTQQSVSWVRDDLWTLRADNTACSPEHRSGVGVV